MLHANKTMEKTVIDRFWTPQHWQSQRQRNQKLRISAISCKTDVKTIYGTQ